MTDQNAPKHEKQTFEKSDLFRNLAIGIILCSLALIAGVTDAIIAVLMVPICVLLMYALVLGRFFWLLLAVPSLTISFMLIMSSDNDEGAYFFIIPIVGIVSLILFFVDKRKLTKAGKWLTTFSAIGLFKK